MDLKDVSKRLQEIMLRVMPPVLLDGGVAPKVVPGMTREQHAKFLNSPKEMEEIKQAFKIPANQSLEYVTDKKCCVCDEPLVLYKQTADMAESVRDGKGENLYTCAYPCMELLGETLSKMPGLKKSRYMLDATSGKVEVEGGDAEDAPCDCEKCSAGYKQNLEQQAKAVIDRVNQIEKQGVKAGMLHAEVKRTVGDTELFKTVKMPFTVEHVVIPPALLGDAEMLGSYVQSLVHSAMKLGHEVSTLQQLHAMCALTVSEPRSKASMTVLKAVAEAFGKPPQRDPKVNEPSAN